MRKYVDTMKTREELLKQVTNYPATTTVEVLLDIRGLLIEQYKVSQAILDYFNKKG